MKILFAFGLTASTLTAIACGGAPDAPSADTGALDVSLTDAPESPAVPAPDPIVEQPAGAEERRVLALVAAEHLEDLNRLVGRYARGDAPVYAGTFTARDNMGSLGPAYQDGVMTNASVNAALTWEDEIYFNGPRVAGWALTVRSATHRFVLSQSATAPGASVLSLVAPNNEGSGLTGACAGCVAAFDATARTLTINAVTNGKWGDGRLLEVAASGTLKRVPANQLTFERLVAVVDPFMDAPIMNEFASVSGERVRGVKRSFREPTAIPEGTAFYSCDRVSAYELDWFVDENQLVRYGVRNMQITGTQTCCNDAPAGGCGVSTCF